MNTRAIGSVAASALLVFFVASCSQQDRPVQETEPPSQSSTSPPGTSDPSEEIRQAFEAYRTDLTNADGDTAASRVSSETISMYQEFRDLAVSGDEDTLKNLSMINRFQVLLMRHRIKPASLKTMDGPAVFSHAVENEWIGKDSVVRAGLSDISASGTRATAKVTVDGQPTPEVFHFVKEDGQWKFDLAPTIKKSDQALQVAARNQGISENEFIFSVITSLSGRQVTEAIWKPIE